jgi:hypothetical protein
VGARDVVDLVGMQLLGAAPAMHSLYVGRSSRSGFTRQATSVDLAYVAGTRRACRRRGPRLTLARQTSPAPGCRGEVCSQSQASEGLFLRDYSDRPREPRASSRPPLEKMTVMLVNV